MAGLETQISRLLNKDVKIRRRAVRYLFEEDNPAALRGFIPLLNDKDPWFKNKSLDAHRKWAKTADDLLPLMDHNQRVAGELLEHVDAPEVAKELLLSDDHITRSFAAKSLADYNELHKKFPADAHH